MVVAPDGLELAELELEAAIFSFGLELARHSLSLPVLENAVLRILVLPFDVTKSLIVHVVIVGFLVLESIRYEAHLDLGGRDLWFLSRLVRDGHDALTKASCSFGSEVIVAA